jgi:two-component system chemotaxis sensor kinase CheA
MNEVSRPMRSLMDCLVLPKEMSAFEAGYLRRMNRVGLLFFVIHVPVIVLLAWLNGTHPGLALALSVAVVAGPALAYVTLSNPRSVSMTYGIAAMFMGGLLVHFGQGPVQIEMHFYFFALIAMLAVFGNPLVILAAAVTVALHHLALWFVLPRSVFNYDAPVWVVAVHALFVVLESVAGCFIARSFFDNVIGLEKIVQARTAELDMRHRDMRRVLDNVTQGFLTIDRAGVLSAERSRVFDLWFEPSTERTESLFDLLERKSPEFAARSREAWEQVKDDQMPLELTLDQMPRELSVGDNHLRVGYVPIVEGESRDRFLVVVTDITAEVSRERAERDRRETMELFERLLSDRSAVRDFFEEGSALVNTVTGGKASDLAVVKRMLHTLKGNSAIFGLHSLSSICHELESQVIEQNEVPPASELARLRDRWEAMTASVDRLLGARRNVIEIHETEHAVLEQSVRRGTTSAALLPMVHALKLEPAERRLEHFGEQVRRIAARLEKPVEVQIDGQGLRVDPKPWAPFWSAFIHGVRNAVDHGLETAEERAALGKSSCGHVALRTYLRGDRFVVEIADDGRGVDWARVGLKATELGLPATTESQLRDALFRDGVSTAVRVTDISGRGVGMGALRAATEALGGLVELDTKAKQGTTLRMVFPKNAMTPDLRTSSSAATAAA